MARDRIGFLNRIKAERRIIVWLVIALMGLALVLYGLRIHRLAVLEQQLGATRQAPSEWAKEIGTLDVPPPPAPAPIQQYQLRGQSEKPLGTAQR